LEGENEIVYVHMAEIRESIDEVAAVLKDKEPIDSDLEDAAKDVVVAHDNGLEQVRAEMQNLDIDTDVSSLPPLIANAPAKD
jgi:hypothetical protein